MRRDKQPNALLTMLGCFAWLDRESRRQRLRCPETRPAKRRIAGELLARAIRLRREVERMCE